MNIEDLKGLMDEFDPASLLPELDGILEGIVSLARMAVMVGPILLFAAGLAYLLLAPREANYTFGYRCAFGMGSVEAWRFTQRLAGAVWSVLGLVLSIVMFSRTGKFADLEISEMLLTAVKCLIWETAIVAVSCIAINTVVMARFTYSGEYRKDRVGK